MQRLEVSCTVGLIYMSLGAKELIGSDYELRDDLHNGVHLVFVWPSLSLSTVMFVTALIPLADLFLSLS